MLIGAAVVVVMKALAALAGNPENLETRRDHRAWELISGLTENLDTTPTNYSEPKRIASQRSFYSDTYPQ